MQAPALDTALHSSRFTQLVLNLADSLGRPTPSDDGRNERCLSVIVGKAGDLMLALASMIDQQRLSASKENPAIWPYGDGPRTLGINGPGVCCRHRASPMISSES